MDIRSAMTAITTTQGALSISSPESVSVVKAWPYFPPQTRTNRLQTPLWRNEWTLVREERHIGLRVQFYVVHMQLLVDRPNLDDAADIATAFMPKVVDAFDAQDGSSNGGVALSLAGVPSVTNTALRGGNPTLSRFDESEATYIGLDLFLDVEMKESKEFT